MPGQRAAQLLTASREAQVLAILLVWNLPDVVFLENFAVRSDCRGQGIGADLLRQVAEIWEKPQVLEVEIPQTERQRRRIAFYQRCGFFLNQTYPYRDAQSAWRRPGHAAASDVPAPSADGCAGIADGTDFVGAGLFWKEITGKNLKKCLHSGREYAKINRSEHRCVLCRAGKKPDVTRA